MDGTLDEPFWATAATVRLPWEVDPGDNAPAPVVTECRFSHDETRLLVGCAARDPEPDRIRAYLTDRDDIGRHDRIVLTLDTFDDERRAFEFGVSALGVQWDAIYDEATDRSDASWDGVWSSAGRITERGYEVEMAIPFRSLRFPGAREVQTWGFYVRRHWPRSEAVELRSVRWNRGDACVLCQAADLTGIVDVSPGINLEVVPTVTADRTDRAGEGGGLTSGDVSSELGFDLRWSPTTALALNATANPDFSQVEADAPQLDVNRRFALFFPEKRPFFLEGADFFSTPIQAVFTRSVADPSFGTKLTGKLGGSVLGAMVVRDEVNNLLLPGNQGSGLASIDQSVTGFFGRWRRDVGASNTVGALYTGRFAEGYENQVFGVDATLQLLSALTVRSQYLHSVTDDPPDVFGAAGDGTEGGRYGGDALHVEAAYADREWRASLRVRALSPEFRADAGFVPQVDVKGVNLLAGRTFWASEGSPLTSFDVSAGGWHNDDWAGRLTDRGLFGNVTVSGPWQSSLWVNPQLTEQWLAGRTHTLGRFWYGGSVRPTGVLTLDYFGFVGGALDFANDRAARQVTVSPGAQLRLGRHLDLRASVRWERLRHAGADVFTASASEARAVYGFNPRAFARAIVQLERTSRNPDEHPFPVRSSETELRTQLLFAYTLTPLSALHVGYGDVHGGHTSPDRGRVELSQQRRTFFVKLGYGWRP